MEPGYLKLTIPRGVDFAETVTVGYMAYDLYRDNLTEAELTALWTLYNVTDATARFKTAKDDSGSIFELTVAGGGIAVGGALGTVDYIMSAAETEAIDGALSGYHELDITLSTGETFRYVEGDWS